MRGFFTPPQFVDEEKNRQARQLHIILWCVILAITVVETLLILLLPANTMRWLSIAALVDAFSLVLHVLNRRGKVRLASWLIVLMLWGLGTGLASTAGGLHATGIYIYIVDVLTAGILLGIRLGFVAAVGCSLTGLGLVYAEWAGVLPQAVQNSAISLWVALSGYLIIAVGLQYIATDSIRKSLQKTQQELAERRQAEMALRESENRYRSLADATFEGIITTEKGLIVDANQQLAKMLGYPLEEVYGLPLISFVNSIDAKRAEEILASGEEQIGEYRVRRKDGSEIIVESHGRAFEVNQKQVRISSVRDITERRRAEEELHHEAERSKTLARISSRLTTSLELQEVLDTICEEIAHLIDAPATIIFLVDDELKFHHLKAAFGLSPENIKQVAIIPNRIHPLWQKKLENIYYLADVQEIEDSNNVPLMRQFGWHTAMNCLLFYDGQIIGLLDVLRYESGWNYSDADLTLLQTLTNQIAIAIHNAQLFEQVKSGHARLQALSEKLVDIQEAERRHLAIELHDEIGQALTHIKMNLDRFDPMRPEKGNLDSARAVTIDLMKRIRGLSLELRPTVLDDLGLVPAILWHIDRYTAQTGIQVDFKSSSVDRRFRPLIESTAYRILQESLTNVARHAAASRVTVSLWADEERLGLQVEDDGIGFDKAAALEQLTGGLSGMQERASLCGGQLLIDSHLGQGTYISLVLPFQGEFIERRTR